MRPSHLDRFGLTGGLLSVLLSACTGLGDREPSGLRVPELLVEAPPHVGTSLTGPQASIPVAVSAIPLGLRHRAIWVERSVATSGILDPRVSLVIGPGDADPLRSVARRANGVGFARGSEAAELERALAVGAHGRTRVAWDESAALDPGTTLRLKARSPDASFAFLVDASRADDAVEARIAVQVGLSGGAEAEKLVLADPLRASDGPMAFVFARTAARDEPAALVIVLEIVDAAVLASRPAADRGGVEESVAAAVARSREITRSEEERREIRGVLADLERPSDRRARLVFLASSCAAPLAVDIALIATDADLREFAEAVKGAVPESADRAQASWPIERAAWRLLGQKAAAGMIAPELSGVLARQGGEAARFPGAIEDLVRGVDSVAGLTRRLAAENRTLLEDGSPSSRLRAYDWLAARGLAPAEYDPLGTITERRAALRKLADAEEAAARVVEKSP